MTTLTSASPTLGGGAIVAGAAPVTTLPASAGISPADLWRIIRQRMLLIMLLGIFLTGLGVGGVLFWYFRYPGYMAEAYIEVKSLQMRDPTGEIGEDRLDTQAIQREIQSQVFLIQSPEVLDNTLKEPEIRRTQWFAEAQQEAKLYNENETDLLKDMLSVGSIRDTDLIRVAAEWVRPDEVPNIVNTLVQQYMAVVNKRSETDLDKQLDELKAELTRSQTLFEESKNDIARFIGSTDLSGSIDMEVNELVAHATELELLVSNLRSIWEEMRSMKPSDIPIDQQMQAMLLNDPDIVRLEGAAQAAKRNYDLVRQKFLENHPTTKDAKSVYGVAAQNLESERAQKIRQFQLRRLEEAEKNYTRTNYTLVQVKEKLAVAREKQADKNNKIAQYQSMLEEQDLRREQYQMLLDKKNKLDMLKRQERKVRIAVVQSAIPPKRISSPNLAIFLPMCALGGFGLSLGLAFLIDLTDKSVRTPRDIARTQLPVLGTIPTTDDDQVDIERVETACLEAPHSIVAEAFRSLRANLFFSAPAEQQGVILVTSPSAENGKTTVASNLAISIALSGRRVLLIDANFRRAALPRIFPNVREEGLSNVLVGHGQLSDFVTPTQVPGLDVLSAGPIPQNPAELLGSSYLRDVIVDARSRYDQVIFDGPPVLLVSDAMVLAGAVDGCLLVCQYRRTSRGALQRTRSNLEAINARIFGAVLNEVQIRRGGYFKKTYEEFYDYQEQDDDQPQRPVLDVAALGAVGVAGHTDAEFEGPASHHEDDRDDRSRRGGGGVESPSYSSPQITRATVIDDDADAIDELEDEPPIPGAAPAAAPKKPQSGPVVPDVEMGSGLDLGSLPDLSDLDSLDVRIDPDLDRSASPRKPSTPPATDHGRSEEDALDLENLADELEELEGEDFRIDDRYDLGDDTLDDESDSESR